MHRKTHSEAEVARLIKALRAEYEHRRELEDMDRRMGLVETSVGQQYSPIQQTMADEIGVARTTLSVWLNQGRKPVGMGVTVLRAWVERVKVGA